MAAGNREIKPMIRKFIVDNYLAGDASQGPKENDSFLEKGIIDSIGVIELTAFIQEKYKIRIRPHEIAPENFDTLNNLERYILRKQSEKTP